MLRPKGSEEISDLIREPSRKLRVATQSNIRNLPEELGKNYRGIMFIYDLYAEVLLQQDNATLELLLKNNSALVEAIEDFRNSSVVDIWYKTIASPEQCEQRKQSLVPDEKVIPFDITVTSTPTTTPEVSPSKESKGEESVSDSKKSENSTERDSPTSLTEEENSSIKQNLEEIKSELLNRYNSCRKEIFQKTKDKRLKMLEIIKQLDLTLGLLIKDDKVELNVLIPLIKSSVKKIRDLESIAGDNRANCFSYLFASQRGWTKNEKVSFDKMNENRIELNKILKFESSDDVNLMSDSMHNQSKGLKKEIKGIRYGQIWDQESSQSKKSPTRNKNGYEPLDASQSKSSEENNGVRIPNA